MQQNQNEQHRGRHFQIRFALELENIVYYIKDLGIGFGAFKKMDIQDNGLGTRPEGHRAGKVVLKDNMLVNVGEAYIVVNLLPEGLDDEGPHDTLRLKIFGGANTGEIYEFNVSEM